MRRLSYLRERSPLLVAWVVQVSLLAAVWMLAPGLRADRTNLLYALLLLAVAAGGGFLVDYLRFAARRRALERLAAPPVSLRNARSEVAVRDPLHGLVEERDQAHARALAERERAAREDDELFDA